MKTKRVSFFHILTTAWAVVLLAFTPFFATAAEFQRLSDTVAGQLGYNYIARVIYTDITNTVSSTQIRLWPRAGFAPAGSAVTRAGVMVSWPYSMSGWNGTSNAVDLSVGWTGTGLTNLLINTIPVGSNGVVSFQTNTFPRNLDAATNFFAATFNFTNATAASFLTNGDVYIYLMISDLAKATNNL
jgi:hypothetical protein